MAQKNKTGKHIIREPAFAGSWYPGDKEALNKTVSGYLNKVKKADLNGTIRAIIVPHAGYIYSGQVAAVSFKQLEDIYSTVFLLGPSHSYPLRGMAITNATHYRTPLGEVKISDKANDMLIAGLKINNEADAKEHSLEIELPFLQVQLKKFELIPIVVGDINPDELTGMLSKNLGKDGLIVVSVDMSHYHSYNDARALDRFSIDKILNLDSKGIFEAEIDAPWAVSGLLSLAKEKQWKPILLHYANSGDITGDKSRVVGYSAIAFVEEKEQLSKNEQEFLLKLARETLEKHLKDGKKPKIDDSKLSPALKKVQGCFTTLSKNGSLRGCIGHIMPQQELYKCVMDNAISAAIEDHRFHHVTYSELKDLKIEISVLTPPKELRFTTPDELKEKLRPMIDGVVLKDRFKKSTYLPQVWEQLTDKEEFLSSLCEKGGMQSDCWKKPTIKVQTYQAFVFSEKE